MKTFDIGFIPSGWRKGEKLDIFKATPTIRGTIQQAELTCLSDPGETPMDAIGYLHFGHGMEAAKAKEWLEWWFKA